mgnify:FL=1
MKFFDILLLLSLFLTVLTDICSFFTERKFDYSVLFIDLPAILLLLLYLYSVLKEHNQNKKIKM